MKQFVTDIVLTALISFLILCSVYLYGVDYTQASNNLYKQQYIEQHGNEICTLILGHSQAAHGINPWVIGDSVFDMAEPSRIPYYDREIFARNISLLPNLKTVIYPLNYHLAPWICYHSKESCEQLVNEYRLSMGIEPPLEFKKPLPLLTLRRVLGYKYYSNKKDCDSLGYISLGNTFNDGEDFLDISVNEDSIIGTLRTMAKICEEHDIRFIIISTPCNNTFNTHSVDTLGVNRIRRIIDSVSIKYPVEYYDYRDCPAFNDNRLFYGQTHLNHTGATLFTIRLKEDLGL